MPDIEVEDNQLLSALSGNDDNFQDNSSEDNDDNNVGSVVGNDDNFQDNSEDNDDYLSNNDTEIETEVEDSFHNDSYNDYLSNNDTEVEVETEVEDSFHNDSYNDYLSNNDTKVEDSGNLGSYNDTKVETEIEDSFNISAGNREYKLDFGGGHGAAAAGGAASVAFVDQSVNANIWAGDDVEIETENTVAQATGEGAWAAGDDIHYEVDASTNIGNDVEEGGEVWVNNTITEIEIEDSFNWEQDNSVENEWDVDIDDSFNNEWETELTKNEFKVEIDESFNNEQEWETFTEFETEVEVDIEDVIVGIAGDDVEID